MKKENIVYLKHILESINDIEKTIKNVSENGFKTNKDISDAIIRRIEVIGEAAKNISSSFKDDYPHIEWKKIIGTRDVLIHAYFSVDLDLIWSIVKDDLPKLKENIKKILKEVI